jgi:hypothetical protein
VTGGIELRKTVRDLLSDALKTAPPAMKDRVKLDFDAVGATKIHKLELPAQDEAAKMLWSDPNLQGTLSSVGYGGARGGSNQGYFRIGLKPRSERPPIDEVIAELRRKLAAIPGLNVYLQNRPVITIGGLISKAQYQYTLQDSNTAELFAASERLKSALAKTPGFLDVTSDLDLSTPSVHVSVDRDRAAALGITMSQIETALGASFGGQQISTINSATDQFKVMLELLPQYQQDAAALNLGRHPMQWVHLRHAQNSDAAPQHPQNVPESASFVLAFDPFGYFNVPAPHSPREGNGVYEAGLFGGIGCVNKLAIGQGLLHPLIDQTLEVRFAANSDGRMPVQHVAQQRGAASRSTHYKNRRVQPGFLRVS